MDITLTLRAAMDDFFDGTLDVSYRGKKLESYPLMGRLDLVKGDLDLRSPADEGGSFHGRFSGATQISGFILSCGKVELLLDPKLSRYVKKEVDSILKAYAKSPVRIQDARDEVQVCGSFLRWAKRVTDEFPEYPGYSDREFKAVFGESRRRSLLEKLFMDDQFVPAFGQPYDSLSSVERLKRSAQLERCFGEGILRASALWMKRDLVPLFSNSSTPQMSALLQRLPEMRQQQASYYSAAHQVEQSPPGLAGVNTVLRLIRENRQGSSLASLEEVEAFENACKEIFLRNGIEALAEVIDSLGEKAPSLPTVEALSRISSGEAIWTGEVILASDHGRESVRRSFQESWKNGSSVNLLDWVSKEVAKREMERARRLARQKMAPIIEGELASDTALKAVGMKGLEEIAAWRNDFTKRLGDLPEAADLERLESRLKMRRATVRAGALRELDRQMSIAKKRSEIGALESRYRELDPDRSAETEAFLSKLSQYYKVRRMLDPCVVLTPVETTGGQGEPSERTMCDAVWGKLFEKNAQQMLKTRVCREVGFESSLFTTLCLTEIALGGTGDMSAELVEFEKKHCSGGPASYRCTFSLRLTSVNPLMSLGLGIGNLAPSITGDFIREGEGWRYQRIE